MKISIALYAISLMLFVACEQPQQSEVVTNETIGETFDYRGDKIDDQNIMELTDFKTSREGKGELNAKLSGKVTSVCKKKGCWMKVDLGDGERLRFFHAP